MGTRPSSTSGCSWSKRSRIWIPEATRFLSHLDPLTNSRARLRRFVLGRQGLWSGRRAMATNVQLGMADASERGLRDSEARLALRHDLAGAGEPVAGP